MPLTSDEESLVQKMGLDIAAADLLKSEAKSRLLPFDPNFESVVGIAVRVVDGEAAEAVIKALQPLMIERVCRLFWTYLREQDGSKIGDAVAMLPSTDHFAILGATKPCAESHSGPEIIRGKFKIYGGLCDLEIVGATCDWVAVQFKTLPVDLCAFAEDIYLFCPDSCDLKSGIGSKQKLTKEKRAAAQALCSGVSDDFRQKLQKKFSPLPGFPEAFHEMLLNDAEWNVRLVAQELTEKMYFFFWWD